MSGATSIDEENSTQGHVWWRGKIDIPSMSDDVNLSNPIYSAIFGTEG